MNTITNTGKKPPSQNNTNITPSTTYREKKTTQVASKRIEAVNTQPVPQTQAPKKNTYSLHANKPYAPKNNSNNASVPNKSPYTRLLENSQKIVLKTVLEGKQIIPPAEKDEPDLEQYVLQLLFPEMNEAPKQELNLLEFLKDLQQSLPYAKIKLIGSGAAYVVYPQIEGYNALYWTKK